MHTFLKQASEQPSPTICGRILVHLFKVKSLLLKGLFLFLLLSEHIVLLQVENVF